MHLPSPREFLEFFDISKSNSWSGGVGEGDGGTETDKTDIGLPPRYDVVLAAVGRTR